MWANNRQQDLAEPREVGLLDSLYMDSLAVQRKLKIEADAPALMKDAIISGTSISSARLQRSARFRSSAGTSGIA